MKYLSVRVMILAILVAVLVVQSLRAAESLPLQPGLYVQQGEKCSPKQGQPVPSVSLNYNGTEFHGGHQIFKISNIYKKGELYYFTVKSHSDGSMGATTTEEKIGHWAIRVISKTSFSIYLQEGKTMDKGPQYQYCGPEPKK